MKKNHILLFLLTVVFAINCKHQVVEKSVSSAENYEQEKKAIIAVLKNETKAAFQRDYEAWQSHWVHNPTISKTYMNFVENSFSETIGWQEIADFVSTYFKEHPEPVPPPAQPEKLAIKVYGTGAWVSYDIMDEVHGLKRETRLMEKEAGKWKIAGMHTTIYGFQQTK